MLDPDLLENAVIKLIASARNLNMLQIELHRDWVDAQPYGQERERRERCWADYAAVVNDECARRAGGSR